MSKQLMTTAVQTSSDFEVTGLMMKLAPADRILVACEVLGKNPAAYGHLDNGRQAMTGANLLRGAARKDSTVLGAIQSAVSAVICTYPADFKPTKKARSKKAAPAAPVVPAIALNWPKSKRFAFAQVNGGVVTYTYTRRTEADIART